MAELLRPPPTNARATGARGPTTARVGQPRPVRRGRARRPRPAAWDRGYDPAGTARQLAGHHRLGRPIGGPGRRSTVPTLVIHGDADPLVTPSGGERTAAAVPGAELLVVEGMGHDLGAAARGRRSSTPSPPTRPNTPESPTGATHGTPRTASRVVEIAGIGPGPVRGDAARRHGRRRGPRRPGPGRRAAAIPSDRPRTCSTAGAARSASTSRTPTASRPCCALVEQADALIEGFRPGVTERLGSAPTSASARNPRLVYGRMTGWGQDGPLAPTAGHDINYIALAGALDRIGPAGARRPCRRSTWSATSAAAACCSPSAWCAALLEAQRSGQGQVVDAAMVDGAASLMTMIARVPSHGHLERRAGHQHARHRRPLLRRLRDGRRQVRVDRLDRAAVLRRAAAADRARGRGAALAAGPERSGRR